MFFALIVNRDGSDRYEFGFSSDLDLYYHLHELDREYTFVEPDEDEPYNDIIVID